MPEPAINEFVLPRRLIDVKGVAAVERLLDAPDGELHIDASRLCFIDAYAAVVIRAGIERLVARRRSDSVQISAPDDAEAAAWLVGLLGELPERCDLHGIPDALQVPESVLLGATRIRDHEQRLQACEQATEATRIRTRRDRTRPQAVVLEAVHELTCNALTHAKDSDVDVVCALCIEPISSHLQVVCLDTGRAVRTSADLAAALRSAATHGDGLSSLVGREIETRMRLVAGDLQLTWFKRSQVMSRSAPEAHLPGFLVGLEVLLRPVQL